MAEYQPRIRERRIAGNIITRAVQPNAVGVGRGIPAELRTVDHDRFRVLGFALTQHPHIAGGGIACQAIGTAVSKLRHDGLAILRRRQREQAAVITFGRSIQHGW